MSQHLSLDYCAFQCQFYPYKFSVFLSFLLVFCFSACEESQSLLQSSETISIGTKIEIYSEYLNEEREIWIHVPEGFYRMNETGIEYPVVYVIDGENLFVPTVGILGQLSSAFNANDQTPQMIVVGIPNTNRNRDLTPTSAIVGTDSTMLDITGGAPAFSEFLRHELIPYVDNHYKTASHRTLIGHSLGGLFAIHSLIETTDLFTNYLVVDPALDWDKGSYLEYAAKKLTSGTYDKKKLFIASADESIPGIPITEGQKDTSILYNIRNSIKSFEEKLGPNKLSGITIQSKFYEGSNHFQISLPAIYDGLRYFYEDHPFHKIKAYYIAGSEQSKKDIIPEIKSHFDSLSSSFNYEVKPMESYLNAWAWGFMQFEKPELTEGLLDLNIDYYPNSAHVYTSKGYYALAVQDSVSALELFKKSYTLNDEDYILDEIRALEEGME